MSSRAIHWTLNTQPVIKRLTFVWQGNPNLKYPIHTKCNVYQHYYKEAKYTFKQSQTETPLPFRPTANQSSAPTSRDLAFACAGRRGPIRKRLTGEVGPVQLIISGRTLCCAKITQKGLEWPGRQRRRLSGQ